MKCRTRDERIGMEISTAKGQKQRGRSSGEEDDGKKEGQSANALGAALVKRSSDIAKNKAKRRRRKEEAARTRLPLWKEACAVQLQQHTVKGVDCYLWQCLR